MAKREKRLRKWKDNTPKDVPVEQVIAMLNYYFQDHYFQKDGSHIKVAHPSLKNMPDYGPDGGFDIPVKHGQKVKGIYIKKLAQTIELLRELKVIIDD